MCYLKSGGVVVFLDIPLPVVMQRIGDYSLRGISRRPDQSLEALFEERLELYSEYADIRVKGEGRNQDEVCEAAIQSLNSYPG
jgi:shikimate kinase